ncbi:hypothetical protein C8R46DRAFT_1031327 [Mycena filopes]|nr:hypothetical protein C8R46DRAFT_1031327 [Mycena filopes]
MDTILATAETERVAGTLTDARVKYYMAVILRPHGFRPLDKHGRLLEDATTTPTPAANDAFVVVEDEVVPHLETTLSEREAQGWARPSSFTPPSDLRTPTKMQTAQPAKRSLFHELSPALN